MSISEPSELPLGAAGGTAPASTPEQTQNPSTVSEVASTGGTNPPKAARLGAWVSTCLVTGYRGDGLASRSHSTMISICETKEEAIGRLYQETQKQYPNDIVSRIESFSMNDEIMNAIHSLVEERRK